MGRRPEFNGAVAVFLATNPETLTTQIQESTQNIAAHDPSRRRHTSTHGGSEPCQSVGRRMLLRLRLSKGVLARCSVATPPSHARMPPSMHTPCALPAVPLRWLCACCTASPAQPSASSCHDQLHPLQTRAGLTLCAPADGRNSFERALPQNFRALRAPSG